MDKHMYATRCDECNEVFAYMDSHPRGYMVCVSCGERLESERQEVDSSEDGKGGKP